VKGISIGVFTAYQLSFPHKLARIMTCDVIRLKRHENHAIMWYLVSYVNAITQIKVYILNKNILSDYIFIIKHWLHKKQLNLFKTKRN